MESIVIRIASRTLTLIASLLALIVPVHHSVGMTVSTKPATSTPEIALTFDDGPYGTSTEQVLTILREKNVHATFFLIGKNVAKYPELTKAILADGNVIGNHSYDHSRLLPLMNAAKFAHNLNQAEDLIASTTGTRPMLYRAPYGIVSLTMKQVLKKEGYTIVPWNDDPKDWDYTHVSSTTIVQTALAEASQHTILILHDGRDTKVNYPRDNMLEALPILIDAFKNKGYRFSTL